MEYETQRNPVCQGVGGIKDSNSQRETGKIMSLLLRPRRGDAESPIVADTYLRVQRYGTRLLARIINSLKIHVSGERIWVSVAL